MLIRISQVSGHIILMYRFFFSFLFFICILRVLLGSTLIDFSGPRINAEKIG
jgi:hypothetical protein